MYIYIYKVWLQKSVALCSRDPNRLNTLKRVHCVTCCLVLTKQPFSTIMRWQGDSQQNRFLIHFQHKTWFATPRRFNIFWQLLFLVHQLSMNYLVKHMVFAGWCSSKSAGLRKVGSKNVCFVNAKQQIPELVEFYHCRAHRQLLLWSSRKKRQF